MTVAADDSPVAIHTGDWRTSSYTASNSNCVEVARNLGGPVVGVRDTKDRSAHTTISPGAWTAFLGAAKAGTFDEPFHV
ncbi:DUF397 domain-containing protein [Streptomyces sedi]|uniref:DUF397 domain-containing protein n=1 Tax=Streptomyces sedi TaxID=555059 RepID=A0A5C4URK9_9ACTN|nr:DUF397 domain-containing protein [Streptomyces sedi]TNM26026.1 DUF397 domain-containing protein [Streptomyces sedi]